MMFPDTAPTVSNRAVFHPTLLLSTDKHIKTGWQPAILLNLMGEGLSEQEANLASHKLLKGTKLFYNDFSKPNAALCADQFLRFIQNCIQTTTQQDLAFRLGQRLLPGYYGDVSHALLAVTQLDRALEFIALHANTFSPLLKPAVEIQEHEIAVQFFPSYSSQSYAPHTAKACHRFLCEAWMFAIKNWIQQQSEASLPWRFDFNYPKPEGIENYEVYLGDNLYFNQPTTCLRLPKQHAYDRWQSPHTYNLALNTHHTSEHTARVPLLNYIRQQLTSHIHLDPSLEWLANELAMSPATLKRRLKSCHTQFRDLLSDVRLQVAVELYHHRQFSNEQICDYLGFYDESNLRRFFKRTTGYSHTQYFSVI